MFVQDCIKQIHPSVENRRNSNTLLVVTNDKAAQHIYRFQKSIISPPPAINRVQQIWVSFRRTEGNFGKESLSEPVIANQIKVDKGVLQDSWNTHEQVIIYNDFSFPIQSKNLSRSSLLKTEVSIKTTYVSTFFITTLNSILQYVSRAMSFSCLLLPGYRVLK